MTVEVLYTSQEVRSAIAKIFKEGRSGRRVAVTAYVGDNADYYLPHPDQVEVICSPTAGATNPNAIRKLISRGANVRFADKLHMKVYWSEGAGVVITSANLSTNALGVGDLKEAGVLLGSESVDIDKLIAPLGLRPAAADLHALDLGHRDYYKKNPRTQKSTQASFAQWFCSPERQRWKLLMCKAFCDEPISQASQAYSIAEIGTKPVMWAWSAERTVVENEWVLCAALRPEDDTFFNWLYVDHVQQVSAEDEAYSNEYPYELLQLRPLKTYEPPPFAINANFKKTFRDALMKLDIESETKSPVSPKTELLEVLRSLLQR